MVRPVIVERTEDLGAAYYERYYRNYAAQNPQYNLRYYRHLARQSVAQRANDPTRVLDIGCAFGDFLASLPAGWRRFGIDANAFAIEMARRRNAAIAFHHIRDFELPVSELDVVTAFDVLEHVPDVADAVDKIHTALRDGGVLVMVVPVYDGPLGPLVHALDKDPTHVHKCSRGFWLRLISERFEILRYEGILRYLLPGIGLYVHARSRSIVPVSPAIAIVGRKRA
jgi:SAM-dependent methyltransferase